MSNEEKAQANKELFRKRVRKDPKLINAYMLVHSDKSGLHLNLADGVGENAMPTPE